MVHNNEGDYIMENNIYHVYCHADEESFQIVGKDNFMFWLSENADCDRHTFASSYKKLMKKVPYFEGECA